MPKKTREQKKIAAFRKKIKLLEMEKGEDPASAPIVKKAENIRLDSRSSQSNNPNKEDEVIKKFFEKDFRRSLTIIAFIIALEIVLYFASIKGVLSTYLNI